VRVRHLAAGLGGLLAVPVVFVIAVAGITPTTGPPGGGQPSALALAEIPPGYLTLYQQAAARWCPGLGWHVLAAVGWVETRHGTSTLPGVTSGANPSGAAGPMQIGVGGRAGNTWGGAPTRPVPPVLDSGYGVDGDGDGTASVYDPADAIPTAAVYLCDHGAADPARLREAIWAYNHSQAYVDGVLAKAAAYLTTPALPAVDGDAAELASQVLANPRLTIYEAGRADIAAAVIDARVLALLQTLSQRWELTVTSLKTGHSMCVGGGAYAGCSVSNHYYGRGVDIGAVDGRAVTPGNTAALDVAQTLAALSGPLRPDEVGTPWPALDAPGFFSDRAHLDHLHIGWEG